MRESEIRARLDAATPGKWEVGDGSKEACYSGAETVVVKGSGYVVMSRSTYPRDKEFNEQVYADIRLAANAPSDLAYLLDENAVLRRELDARTNQLHSAEQAYRDLKTRFENENAVLRKALEVMALSFSKQMAMNAEQAKRLAPKFVEQYTQESREAIDHGK